MSKRKKDIDFRRALKKVLESVHEDCKFNNAALNLLNDILCQLCVDMIEQCRQVYRAEKKGDMTHSHVDHVVKKLFPSKMKAHAAAEGSKTLLKFRTGMLKYKPPPVQPEPSKEKKPGDGREYKSGLKKLLHTLHPEHTLSKNAVRRICQVLNNLADRLSQTSIEVATNNHRELLSVLEARDAVNNILPQTLAEHANSEGSKAVVMFENDLLNYKPAPPSPESRSPSSSRSPVKRGAKGKKRKLSPKGKKGKKTGAKKLGKKVQPKPRQEKIFATGIRKHLRNSNLNFTVNSRGMNVLNGIITDLAKHIVGVSGQILRDNNADMMEAGFIRQAVNNIFPPEMSRHGNCEGSRAVMLYENGILQYNPNAPDRKRKRSPSPKEGRKRAKGGKGKTREKSPQPRAPRPNFKKGIYGILTEIHPYASLSRSGMRYLDNFLLQLCQLLISESGRMYRESGVETLGPPQVQAAVQMIMSRTMSHHAIAEATKALFKSQSVSSKSQHSMVLRSATTEPIPTTSFQGAPPPPPPPPPPPSAYEEEEKPPPSPEEDEEATSPSASEEEEGDAGEAE